MKGNDLRARREKLGVTQEKLAARLEVSVSTIARWEQLKEKEIPNSQLLDLALTALEMFNFHVLEYSHKQGAFHIHTVKEMLRANIQMTLGKDKSNDFLPIGLSPNIDDLTPIKNRFSESLEEFQAIREEKRKKDFLKKLELENQTGIIADFE